LALAWSLEADVWTTDRDFAGAGIATWSTPNLMRALAEGAQDRRSSLSGK
jgi:predicted nucleic acid-binding protein